MPTEATQTSSFSGCGHVHQHEQYHHERYQTSKLMNVIEKISMAALAVFSACILPELFMVSALAGMAFGTYRYYTTPPEKRLDPAGSVCSQGFLEHLTGVRLPAALSLIANVAITVCHIEHHAPVFVPLVGLSIGAWAGMQTAHYGNLLFRKCSFKSAQSVCS